MYAEVPSAFRVFYRPFAGRGPCGRPHPGWEIGYPAMADGHKGRTLQEDRNVHGGSSAFHESYRSFAGRGPCGRPHPGWEIGYPAMADGHKGRTLQEDKAEGLSAISSSHTYHLCGSISFAALREHGGSFGLSCVVSVICRARPLWPSAPRMGNWLPCNGGRPQGPHPARGSECTSDNQGQPSLSSCYLIINFKKAFFFFAQSIFLHNFAIVNHGLIGPCRVRSSWRSAQAWASALLVLTDWAIQEPLCVGRVTVRLPRFWCIRLFQKRDLLRMKILKPINYEEKFTLFSNPAHGALSIHGLRLRGRWNILQVDW